jgi:hypothetical protein
MGVFAQMRFAFRAVVLPQALLEVTCVADVKAAFGIFEDVDEKFRHEKSVTG